MKKYLKSIGFRIILTIILAVLIGVVFFAFFSYIIFNTSIDWTKLMIGNFNLIPVLIIFLIVSLSIIIGCVLSLLLLKGFYSPVSELKNAMLDVSKGVFKKLELPKNSDEEIYDLFTSYNKMINDLNHMESMSKDFIANVSHEFRNPISAINGYATLLQSENLSEEEKNTYLNFIISSTKGLSNLTSNILSISKIENQEIIKKATYSLDEQIRQVILMFDSQITEKNLELIVDLEEINIFSNSELTQSIFQNLVGNAVKFTDKGFIKISMKKHNNFAIFEIEDSGVGMNQATQEKIFSKFYQGETSHETQGNGLGLSLVQTIVKKLDGEIKVISKENQGTKFVVKLIIKNN